MTLLHKPVRRETDVTPNLDTDKGQEGGLTKGVQAMSATKRPWYSGDVLLDCIVPNGTRYTAIPVHSESETIAAILQRPGHDAEANARLIVKACNNFEAMLEGLRAAETHYAMICEVLCADNPPPGGHPVLEQLRMAIAKVEED